MQIEFTGRQTEVPAALKTLAERKLQEARARPARHHPRARRAVRATSTARSPRSSVHSPRLDLAATEESARPGASRWPPSWTS